MKPLQAILFTLFLFVICSTAMAQADTPDSLVSKLKQRSSLRSSFELGQLDIQAYTYGLSHCRKQRLAGKLIPHLLPFQAKTSNDVGFEALSHVSYQWPGDMHLNIIGLQTNHSRKGRQVMRELFRALLPMYAARRHKDYGSNKSFVLPFYDEGPSRYQFRFSPIPESLLQQVSDIGSLSNDSSLCCIEFSPLREHHTLLRGHVLIDSTKLQVLGIDYSGRVDMANFSSQLFFSPDSSSNGLFIPYSSHIDIDYRYLGTRARNSYYTIFKYQSFTPFDSLDRKQIPLDLTPYYEQKDIVDSIDFAKIRPIDLPKHIDKLLYHSNQSSTHSKKRKKHPIETFSETLVEGSKLGTENNNLRIYGPLDPASIGYDGINGVTLQERARWDYFFRDSSELFLRAEIGYAFRLHEPRFRFLSEWTYLPQRRGRIRLEVRRSNSNFSSKFIKTVNDALKNKTEKVNFDSLGLDYFQRYEVTLQHSIELTNGLMLHGGIISTYRNPVKHGIHKATEAHRKELINSHYSDFAPFIRLEYTPHQYYWYDYGYKTYIHSPSPTFAIELSRAIPGILGAESNYGRAEFDMQQSVRITRTRYLAYHLGFGKFFNQKGEYFINYRYFSRSQYPTLWEDDRIGGTFHVLDDYWYASSPSYVQAHLMYDTPFGPIHHSSPLSRFVIKERLYWSWLWSQGKSIYNEFGYGIDNNYFNVGFFVGFNGVKFHGTGFKFRIEIGRHL